MTTDLVLPEIAAQGLVQACDRSLVRQLRSLWNVRLTTRWNQIRRLDSVCVEAGGTAAQYLGALKLLEAENAEKAKPSQLAKALAVLTAVCAKPGDFDDAKVVLWSERLKQVLGEFPAPVALAAVSDWPKSDNGKWWPTEKEMRDACGALMVFRHALEYRLKEAAEIAGASETQEPPFEDGMLEAPPPDSPAWHFVQWMREHEPERERLYLADARYTALQVAVRTRAAQFALTRFQRTAGAPPVAVLIPYALDQKGRVTEWAE